MAKLVNMKMIGGAYKNGFRYSGCSLAYVEGESNPRYYPEHTCFNDMIADLESKGVDCADMKSTLDAWVSTGK